MKNTIAASVKIACLMAGSQLGLAELLGVNSSFVSQWKSGKRAIPIKHCQSIVELCEGLVSVQELRPDDWHEFWPLPGSYVPSCFENATLMHVKGALFRLFSK